MGFRKRYLLSYIVIVLVLLSSIYLSPESQPKVKATWLWDSAKIKDERESILTFAGRNGINLIYLHIDPKQGHDEYRAFIKEAAASDIQVHALGGDPSWAEEANRFHIKEFISWIEQYNREAASEHERFKGIHLDIEPYNQEAWETEQRQAVIDGWLAGMEYFIELTKDFNQMETGADLPFWLDEIPVSRQPDAPSMSRWMIERLDHITLMAYRDQADKDGGIVELVREEIETANELNKKVIVGIETNPMKDKYTTFYGKSADYKHEQLDLIESLLADESSYYGIAIHDYKGWSQLASK
ncbi:MAG: hypothetical protein K0S39_602 [Paenibacillus sp.]|nr:hypothetical protein [Paenibacillus sp.]